MYLSSEVKNLRVSRDWVGDKWMDIEPNPNILCVISSTSIDTKLSTSSAASKEAKSDNSPTSVDKFVTSNKLSVVDEAIHELAGMTLTNVPLKDECTDAEQQKCVFEAEEKEYSNSIEQEMGNAGSDLGAVNVSGDDNNLVECEIAEVKCEAEAAEMLLTGC